MSCAGAKTCFQCLQTLDEGLRNELPIGRKKKLDLRRFICWRPSSRRRSAPGFLVRASNRRRTTGSAAPLMQIRSIPDIASSTLDCSQQIPHNVWSRLAIAAAARTSASPYGRVSLCPRPPVPRSLPVASPAQSKPGQPTGEPQSESADCR